MNRGGRGDRGEKMSREDLDQLCTAVLDAAFEVHRQLGPGLMENAYEMALCHELTLRDLRFERQKDIHVHYKGINLDCGYRIDVLVEGAVILELKSCEQLIPLFDAVLLNYLMLSDVKVGYLINFNVRLLKNGIKRLVHRLPE